VTDVQLGFGLDRHQLAECRVQVLRLHGDGLADRLKAHARDGLGKTVDFVFWKFPVFAR
jgi:hypothetical protein